MTAAFDLHPLAIEDVEGGVRPKTEPFSEYTFVLLTTAELATGETTVADEYSDRIGSDLLGDDWFVTISRAPSRPTDHVRRTATNSPGRPLARGPDFLACQVIDALVEDYYDVLDDLEAQVERVEERALAGPDAETIKVINEVRRDLLSFWRLVWPPRAAIGAFARGDSPQVGANAEKYYRDVYDHLAHLVETYRDLTRGVRDTCQNTLTQSTNDVMKTFTAVATIVLPLTLVTGVYGMNFRVMPELQWTYGYPAALLGMAALALAFVLYFERREYL